MAAEPVETEIARRTGIAQEVYTRRKLRIYDALVLGFFCSAIWRCPPRTMQALYDESVGARHLDVGPGTGYFVDRARFPVPDPRITLLDLSAECLESSARRIARHRPETVRADILKPLPLPEKTFDSIGLNLVYHTIPGGWEVKGRSFGFLARSLRPGGVLFGTTVLDQGVPMNRLTRRLMDEQHRRGNFQNQGDDPEGLTTQLRRYFHQVMVRTQGCVALFSARDARERRDEGPTP